jgi:FlaG/FlaF family flagellin (archaellin)
MRGPAGMGDTDGTAHVLVVTELTKIVNLAFRLIDVQVSITVNEGYASRVVATVFQSPESFNQNRIGLFRANITYYSTHIVMYLFVLSCSIFGCKNNKK